MAAPRPRLELIEGGNRPRAPFAAAAELAALGAGLTLCAAFMAALPDWRSSLGTFQALFAAAFAFYALALVRLRRWATLPGVGLAVFGVALAARLALLPAAPSLSDDVYRYVWEGRVIAHGGDPWRHGPQDPALAGLRDARIYPHVNHPELRTLYPPLAEAGFALVARVSPTVAAMKGWAIANDLAVVLVLLAWLSRRGESAALAIAYAWNPLQLVEVAGSGHYDPAALVWLAAALMLARARPLASAAALSVAVLVKLAPLLALPFLWRRWPWRARLLAVVLIGAGLAWFWSETRGAGSGVVAYWDTWRNNALLFDLLERWTGRFAVARAIGLAIVGVTIAVAVWKRVAPEIGTRLTLRVALLVAPVLHPWYLGWELMFQPLALSAPWLVLSCLAILNYGVLVAPAAGAAFHLSLGWRAVEYGVPALLAIVLAARGRAAARA